MQTALLFNFRLFGAHGRHLTLVQRAVGLGFDLRQFVQVLLPLSYLGIPFALLSGYPLVIWTTAAQLKILIRLIAVHMFCHWSHQGVMGLIASMINGQYDVRTVSYDAELEQWLSPCTRGK